MRRNDFMMQIYSYRENERDDVREKILLEAKSNPLLLIHATTDKSIWPTCAKLLVQLPYEILKKNMLYILEGYMDINWPGVNIISDYLCDVPKEDLIDCLEKAFLQAKDDNDWLFGLVSLAEETDVLKHFFAIEEYKELIIKSDYF